MKKLLFLLLIALVLSEACLKKTVTIRFDNPYIRYTGRIDTLKDAAVLYWPGTSIYTDFKGTGIKVKMKDSKGKNYYNVIIDGKYYGIFKPDTIKSWIQLADGLKDTIHRLEIFRRADAGPSWFYAFRVNAGGFFTKLPPKHKRVIEFYGNSITVGASIHDYSGNDYYDSTYTDNYLSYGAITARYFKADYYCIARGGLGLMVSWFPMIMPEMYNRTNPDDPASKWDFSKITPDIVVINLFQNDAALFNMPEHPQFKARFGNKPPSGDDVVAAYADFLKKIRSVYPDADIICTLGTMSAVRDDKPWKGYVKKAVSNLNDDKVYTLFFPYQGGYNHPRVEEHQMMADSLIAFIEKNIQW